MKCVLVLAVSLVLLCSLAAASSPDDRSITDLAGRSNIWKVKASGGWPLQLTQSDDRQYGAAWSPDGKWIVFQQDTGGNELWDLYAVPSEDGTVVNLTNTPDIREEGRVGRTTES